jgi:NADPH:quinone reductase
MRTVVFVGRRGREVMRFEERSDPAPGPNDLLVAVSFAGLNGRQRAGNYPPPPDAPPDIPGLEVAGVVAATGDAVHTFSVGDRVFGPVGGGELGDRVVVHERHVARVPDGVSDEDAAAVPETFITAHDAMVAQAALALRAIVTRAFPAEDAADAFDHMGSSGKFGKVVLAF